MKFSRPVRLLLAIGSGLAMAFAFPNYNLPLLAWISVALLILALLGAGPGEAALYGLIQEVLFYSLSIPWIATVMRQYGGVGPWTAAGILGLMTVTAAVFPIIFAVLVARVGKINVGMACLLAPFLWVAMEFAHAHLPILAFPWNLLGYAASGNLALVQLTCVTGILGLSSVVAAFNAVLAWAIAAPSNRSRTTLMASTLALLLAAWFGPYLVPRAHAEHIAHLVQTNFAQSESYPANWMQLHAADMQQLESISIDAARRSPGLIVWPEVPAPFSLQDAQFNAIARSIALNADNDFLVGVVGFKLSPSREVEAMNRAVLLGPAGRPEFTYDKIHLVPFGEYVPLRHWLGFARSLTSGIGDFTPGHEYSVGQLPGGQFSVFICYEAVFGSEIRRFAANGAQLLINISNDGWFGKSSAPAQHLMMARVRAVENRRWLLRDTNTGFTADFDPYGRTVASLTPYIRGELDAPYGFRTDLTIYTRFGDWFAWLSVILSLAILAAAAKRHSAAR